MIDLWQDSSVESYQELRIEILGTGARERYEVRVRAPMGEAATGAFRNPVGEGMVEEALASVSRATNQWVQRGTPDHALDPVKEVGSRLFDALCQGRLRPLYDRELRRLADLDQGLRIRLVVEEPRLEALPWEFLYDTVRRDFLALSIRSLLVRHPFGSERRDQPDPLTAPLRALVVTADLTGGFGVEQELDTLQKLEGTGLLQIDVAADVTPDSFLEKLREHKPHVLHFIGTGVSVGSAFPTEPGRQSLALMTGERRRAPAPELGRDYLTLDAERIEDALSDQPQLRLVYLSACDTDWLARRLANRVPGTIGMRGLVTGEACAYFTEGMYRAILDHQPLDAAVTQARRTIDLRKPGGREWGIPVFYLATPAGVLLPRQQPSSQKVSRSPLQVESTKSSVAPNHQREARKIEALLAVQRRNLEALERLETKYRPLRDIEEQIKDAKTKIAALEGQLAHLEA